MTLCVQPPEQDVARVVDLAGELGRTAAIGMHARKQPAMRRTNVVGRGAGPDAQHITRASDVA